jgi:molybdate transport system ATP-binding protein
MKAVTVCYRKVRVFDKLDWSVRPGEYWLVTGPNGAGKSTLLSLITADNPQAYQNEIFLFGRLRGSGESIWDIK